MTIMQRKGPDLIGENALKSNAHRSADVQAETTVKAILLYRTHYELALSDYEQEQQELYIKVMKNAPIYKEWSLVKIVGYAM